MYELNNPGNIRVSAETFQGEVRPGRHTAFKEFASMAYGFRAMFVVLRTYMTKHHCRTIEDIITRWAPPTENHTESYIGFVEKAAGIDRKRSLKFCLDDLGPIVTCMAFMENGHWPDANDVVDGWRLL